MNKILLIAFTIFCVWRPGMGQTSKKKLSIFPLIEKRVYELDGGKFIVTGQSRVRIKVDLPPNTLEWYYIFTSYSDKQAVEDKKESINLASQLTRVIDQTGTTASAFSVLFTPSGSNACSV